MTNTDVYRRNFQRLLTLVPEIQALQPGGYLRLEANGCMALSIDGIDREGQRLRFSMAHNFEQNGDLVPDPDMELSADFEARTLEALTFQDQRRYHEVYPAPGKVRPDLKRSLNSFLSTWLSNLLQQGHRLVEDR